MIDISIDQDKEEVSKIVKRAESGLLNCSFCGTSLTTEVNLISKLIYYYFLSLINTIMMLVLFIYILLFLTKSKSFQKLKGFALVVTPGGHSEARVV